MKKTLALLMFLCLPTLLLAQVDMDENWQRLWEEWVEQTDQESIPDEVIELIEDCRLHPINLNDTTNDRLLMLPFLSQFQREALHDYIVMNGPLFSLAELEVINGFDSRTIRMLSPLVYVGEMPSGKLPSLKTLLTKGHGNLVVGGKRTLERARGYYDSIYRGDPYRTYFRYHYQFGETLQLQLSGEKDAGEAFSFEDGQAGFDHYAGYLALNNIGRLSRLVVGNYYLQFGQGLTLWNGFSPWITETYQHRLATGIRPAGGMSEYGMQRGAATTIKVCRKLELSTFYSHNSLDATLPRNGTETQVQSLYQSGYHRTKTEYQKRNLLTEQLFGADLRWNGRYLNAGIVGYHSLYSKEIIPQDQYYNKFSFRGNHNSVGGIYASYLLNRWLLFGEASLSDRNDLLQGRDSTLPLSAIVGVQLILDGTTRLSLSYRHYSPTYQNLHGSAIGENSSNANEQGVLFALQSQLFWGIKIDATANLYQFPMPKYGVFYPSHGQYGRISLSKDFNRRLNLHLQYRNKGKEQNVSLSSVDTSLFTLDPHLYTLESTSRQQLQLRLNYLPNDRLTLSTRADYSWHNGDYHTTTRGILLLQDVSYHDDNCRHPFSLTGRAAAFNIGGYDARIYAMESDLMYEFASLSLQGKGLRTYLLAHVDLSRHWTVTAKYGLVLYSDRDSIGSGYELIPHNHKQELKVQLRLKF